MKNFEWCRYEEIIYTDNKNKKYRCPECGRRLNLMETKTSIYLKFPPHKKKGYKIKRKKGHNERKQDKNTQSRFIP